MQSWLGVSSHHSISRAWPIGSLSTRKAQATHIRPWGLGRSSTGGSFCSCHLLSFHVQCYDFILALTLLVSPMKLGGGLSSGIWMVSAMDTIQQEQSRSGTNMWELGLNVQCSGRRVQSQNIWGSTVTQSLPHHLVNVLLELLLRPSFGVMVFFLVFGPEAPLLRCWGLGQNVCPAQAHSAGGRAHEAYRSTPLLQELNSHGAHDTGLPDSQIW